MSQQFKLWTKIILLWQFLFNFNTQWHPMYCNYIPPWGHIGEMTQTSGTNTTTICQMCKHYTHNNYTVMSLEMFSKKLQLDTLVDPSFLLPPPSSSSLSKLFFGQTQWFLETTTVLLANRLGSIFSKWSDIVIITKNWLD